jgi:hypothetical protein
MKKTILLIAFTSLSLIQVLLASSTFRVYIIKNRDVEVSQLLRCDSSVTAALTNGKSLYYVNVTVGTPGQSVALQIDTGSSDVWMLSVSSPGCVSEACIDGSCKSKSHMAEQSHSLYAYHYYLRLRLLMICAKNYLPEQLTPTYLPHTFSALWATSKSNTEMGQSRSETTSKIR